LHVTARTTGSVLVALVGCRPALRGHGCASRSSQRREPNPALANCGAKDYLGALKTILDNFNNMTNWHLSPLCQI
jgi:hypothetical protein